MAEKDETVVVEQPEQNMDDIIQQINDLKENSVPKEKYNKLVEDNKKLTKALIEGKQMEDPNTKKEEISQKDLLARVFRADGRSNLEHWKDALEYRNREIEAGNQDPFVAVANSKYSPDESSYAAAEKLAKGIQDIIDQSDNDPKVFDTYFEHCLNEPPLPKYR